MVTGANVEVNAKLLKFVFDRISLVVLTAKYQPEFPSLTEQISITCTVQFHMSKTPLRLMLIITNKKITLPSKGENLWFVTSN